ncbi:MAG: helicase-related protein [Promethearchaeota archaeon]
MSDIKEDKNRNEQVLNYQGLEIRKYQIKIAESCKDRNSLVVLPTGLGKTIIAVLVTNKILQTVPSNSKIIILAPTRPLINQHYETFLHFLHISDNKFAVLTGKTLPANRINIFNKGQILFFTPQTLRNDLVNKRYTLKEVALIILDEAHHSSGDYPYTMIADEYVLSNQDGIILALTASPGASKKKINKLCENLHIPIKNIHIRTRRDEDVKDHLNKINIYKIGVDLNIFMEDIYKIITYILEERLHYLSHLNFLEAKGENLHEKIIRKDLIKLNGELVELLKSNGDKTGIYSAISINAQALILYHMLELVEQQGLDSLLDYLIKLYKDSKKKNSSKATRVLTSDHKLYNIYLELKKKAEYSPESLIHPKYPILKKILIEELDKKPHSRILVFTKLRNSVNSIVKKLEKTIGIKPVRFVGQTTKSSNDKGLSQKRQIEILNLFKQGYYNVLVATNVGEEGLDIAECDLVVFYDVVASEIRYIQRKGRTARHREGKVIILYSKKTQDEIYLRIVLNKLKRMNSNLKEPKQLNNSHEKKYRLKDKDLVETLTKENPQEKKIDNKKNLQNKISRNQQQSKLTSYMQNNTNKESLIKLSKYFPMNFGLRKKLHKDNLNFDIVESNLHVLINNKVLIQIYKPTIIQNVPFLKEVEKFKQISSLLIIIFDFTDYKEKVEGEKRIYKRQLQELGFSHNFQVIVIDNEEEIYFIIKNILEASK